MTEEEVLWTEAPDSEDAVSCGGIICSASVAAGLYVCLMPDDESR
jgi:hypothetical protein